MDKLDKIRAQTFDYIKDYDRKTDANRKVQTKNLLNYLTPEGEERKRQAGLRRKKLNEAKYGQGVYEVRSPGNDLLDFYDRQNELLEGRRKSVIPPSIVFKIRFRTKMPNTRQGANQHQKNKVSVIRDICKSYKQTDDNSYWHQVYKTRFDWLVDKKSKSWKFKFRSDALEFVRKKLGNVNLGGSLFSKNESNKPAEMMWFRGEARGWSVTFTTK